MPDSETVKGIYFIIIIVIILGRESFCCSLNYVSKDTPLAMIAYPQ